MNGSSWLVVSFRSAQDPSLWSGVTHIHDWSFCLHQANLENPSQATFEASYCQSHMHVSQLILDTIKLTRNITIMTCVYHS